MKKIVPLLTLLLATSCDFLTGGYTQFDESRFYTEKQAWEDQNLQNYSYEYYSAGFTYERLTISVTNGTTVTSTPLPESQVLTKDSTIGDLYNTIEAHWLANKDVFHRNSDYYDKEITIEYDSHHVPIRVNYLPHIPEGMAVDGNFSWEVRNFTVE